MRWLPLHAAFLAALFVVAARADADDDFANNLFSDLGPVLALFGEKVTMQFMSEAMGRADSIVLAMAPIGILTIIVAAIRVAGPLWLKAVVGRARESVSAAELELMSSTSEEVCELYNGQSIVRCQGKPKIWEFIFLFKKRRQGHRPNDPPDVEFKTLSQAWGEDIVDGRDMTGWQIFWWKIMVAFRGISKYPGWSWKRSDTETGCHTNSSEEAKTPPQWDVKVIRDITSDSAPNITLNGHDQISRVQIHAAAVFATLLQAGLIIFFGIISYHPEIKSNYLKDNEPVEKSAFPLVASGTALLVFGLFICGHVIEASTTENQYRSSDGSDITQIMWIQRGQTVWDQVFKPYATLPRSKRTIITTSRRRLGRTQIETSSSSHAVTEVPCDDGTTPSDNSKTVITDIVVENVASILNEEWRLYAKGNMDLMRNWVAQHIDETKTVAGVGVCLIGFVAQFVGFRKMNWAASVAQLSAVLIMVGVRAWIRRGISQPLAHRELAADSELEWLAMVLGNINHNPDPCFDFLKPTPSRRRMSMTLAKQAPGHIHTVSWTVNTDIDQDCRPLTISKDQSAIENGIPRSRAQSVLEIHRELGKLSNCRGQYFDLAIRLANCMEAAMKHLLTSQSQGEKALNWFVLVQDRIGEAPQWVLFRLKRDDDSSPWRVAADEIASALSLWVHSARDCAQRNKSLDAKIDFNHLNRNDDTWLRKTGPESVLGLRALRPGKAVPLEQLIQDFMWWVPDDLSEIIGVGQAGPDDLEEHASTLRVGSSQMIGFPSLQAQHVTGSLCHEHDRTFQQSEVYVEDKRRQSQETLSGMSGESEYNKPWERPYDLEDHEAEYIKGSTMLAIKTYDEPEVLYAKALLCLFLRSVAKTLDEPMKGQAETRVPPSTKPNMNSPVVLWHKDIAELASQIQQNGLGSSLEAHLSIIWPLSLEEKLPLPWSLFDYALSKASEVRMKQDLITARFPYLSLWQQCKGFRASEGPIYACVLACLIEYLKDLHNEKKIQILMSEKWLTLDKMCDWFISLLTKEREQQPQVYSQLSLLYGNGRHPWPHYLQGIDPITPDEMSSQDVWSKALNMSVLHGEAIQCPDILNSSTDGVTNLLSSRDATRWTPLHYMITSGNASRKIDVYLDKPSRSKIDEKDLRGWTLLHYACWYGRDKTVADLIRIGASISCQGFDGASPFHCAIRCHEIQVLQTLLDSQKQQENDSSGYGSESAVDQMQSLSHGKVRTQSLRDHEGRAAIHWAILLGNQKAVQLLLDDKEIRDNKGRTPLHTAAVCCRLDIVKLLVNAGANIEALNHFRQTPLHLAAVGEDRKMVKLLLNAGADLEARDVENKTPLDLARNFGIAYLLSSAGETSKPNIGWQSTSLHLAIKAGKREEVKWLLDAGANIKERDAQMKTPLFIAVEEKKIEIVKLLLDAGADTDVEDTRKNRPLHIAIEDGDTDMVKLLLDAGANARARDRGNQNPLHIAVEVGKVEMVKLLIEAEGDIWAVDSENETAYLVANRDGKEEIAQLLWAAGARGSGWARTSRGIAELM